MARLIPHDAPEIRVAVAGMGKMGGYHLSALQRLIAGETESYYKGDVSSLVRRLRICGVCDSRQATLDQYMQFHCYSDFAELLAKEHPHLAIICTPTRSHFDLASKALRYGVHTLVEKPIATSRRDFDTLLAIAGANEVRLMSGHVERYNPVAIKIVASLEENSTPPLCYAFTRSQPHPERIPDDIVVDKAIHDLDLALYFFGPTRSVSVLDRKIVQGQIREAMIELQHKNGVKGTVLVSWLVKESGKKRSVEINFKNGGTWQGDFLGKDFTVDGKKVQCEVKGMCQPVNNQIKDELVDFIAYSSEWPRGVTPVLPLLSVEEIAESMALLEKCASLMQ